MRGDCITCAKIATCSETSVEKVLASYTCPLFAPVPEPIFEARWETIKKYGEVEAIRAMMRPQIEEGDDETD